ncbi:MAG: hypothetical protein ACPG4K_14390, partial [Haloferula sp.]
LLTGRSLAEAPVFKSELFEKGKLVYADDFDGEYNSERWGSKQGKQLEDGKMRVVPKFKTREEAMKKLKRDHHLGLEPVTSLKGIPDEFVCRMRYQFEMPKLLPGRPSFQIGHHMIVLGMLEGGGHRVKLPDGPSFQEPESGMKIGEWVDLVIEYKKGTLRLVVNGQSKTYEHERVTTHNAKDKFGTRFTFKGGDGCRILFDSIQLWDCTE